LPVVEADPHGERGKEQYDQDHDRPALDEGTPSLSLSTTAGLPRRARPSDLPSPPLLGHHGSEV
jgi:hypothetical protein